ncbi:MAG: LysR family transcriptional regulator [Bacteroidota bacterium]
MSYQIELRHLHYFLILSEELHYRKAADRLFISQPGLSKQIKYLEDLLAVRLLDRNKRNVSLTPAGEYLSNQIKQLDKKVDEMVHGTRLIDSGLKGNLRIGYIGSAMQNIIPELLKSIDRDFPDIQFGLYEMGNSAQVEKLLHHSIDLGFVRMDHLPKSLKAITVYEDTFSVVLPENHPIADVKLDDLSRMKEEKFILFESSYSQSYYLKVMQIFADAGFTPKVAHHTIHANSIFRLVENGFGIAIIPTSLKLGYDLKVKFAELSSIAQRASIVAVWNPDNTNPVLANVIETLQN